MRIKDKIYKCKYCKENSVFRTLIKTHEQFCVFNPSNRACNTCVYLNPDWKCEKGKQIADQPNTDCKKWSSL